MPSRRKTTKKGAKSRAASAKRFSAPKPPGQRSVGTTDSPRNKLKRGGKARATNSSGPKVKISAPKHEDVVGPGGKGRQGPVGTGSEERTSRRSKSEPRASNRSNGTNNLLGQNLPTSLHPNTDHVGVELGPKNKRLDDQFQCLEARSLPDAGQIEGTDIAVSSSAKPEPNIERGQRVREESSVSSRSTKAVGQRQGFKVNEFVVYPAHGVGQIVALEEQEVAGFRLELFVISFSKDKMTLRVPTSKVAGVGLRKISDSETAGRSLEILTGRARVKRTMWSRRAQEYESKINSGDISAIAEVVRDLYRSEAQPEQSYSERQLYEAALDRMVREIAAVQKSNEIDALKAVEAQLQKGHGRGKVCGSPSDSSDTGIEEAA
jgi:CarD family transcriptional regulator